MKDNQKTKEHLLRDIKLLQKRVRQLENLKSGRKKEKENSAEKIESINKELIISRDELECSLNQLEAQRQLILFEKNRFQTIIQYMGEGLLVINDLKEIELINEKAKEMLGFGGAEEIPFGYEKSFILKLWKELHQSEQEIVKKELHLYRPKETMLMITLVKLPQTGSTGGFAVVMRDITFEKQVEKMKSDFVANVSHEIRSPMAPMKEALALVLDGTAGDITEKQKHFLSVLDDNLERLLRLVNDLLDLSKIESGKIELKRERISITYLLKETITSIRVYAEKKNIDLSVEGKEDLPQIICDRDRIIQVIINLVMNAIKFTPAGGKVAVSAKQFCGKQSTDDRQEENTVSGKLSAVNSHEDYIVVCVRDTGPGISQEDARALFDRFKQLVTPVQVKGTGLGLAISKEIIEMHNGRIWVESEGGKGSAFNFILPVEDK